MIFLSILAVGLAVTVSFVATLIVIGCMELYKRRKPKKEVKNE